MVTPYAVRPPESLELSAYETELLERSRSAHRIGGMEPRHGPRAALIVSGGGGAAVVVALVLAIPFLAMGAGISTAGTPPSQCGQNTAADDGTPPILGSSELSATDLRKWWGSSRSGQPDRLTVPIEELIDTYLSEAATEGVRGDLAFAQAVHETGWFTNTDTAINNFAGIAHYDGAASGSGFDDATTGVRAQIQLLKKFVDGNDAALAHEDVSPNAGAQASTWGQLAGTWATDGGYWDALSTMFTSMKAGATSSGPKPDEAPASGCAGGGTGNPNVHGDYSLPVDQTWWDQHPEWFTKPHHDYPAADIPVPVGTPLYAVTSGTVVSTTMSGRCGYGVTLNGDDGAQYTYCHGNPGSHQVAVGDLVTPGQLLLESASTGNSTGPHLHFAIRIDGTSRCPQDFLASIAEGTVTGPSSAPGTGCTA